MTRTLLPSEPLSFHALPADEVARRLDTDKTTGLRPAEAAERLERFGPNELLPPKRDRFAIRLLRQLIEPMALLLGTAAAVAGFGLGERVDALAIVAIVLANVGIALLQEGKAARALEALRTMQVPTATVRRSGARTVIPAREVVPGDLVELSPGDQVPADLRLLETASLEIDESILTGESLPVLKDESAAIHEEASVAERRSMAFSGTLTTRGTGRGIVVATGPGTRLGAIAERLRAPQPKTPLQRELRRLTTRLGIIAVIVAVLVFLLTLVRADATTAFLSAVALAVAAVPEGLPTVVTVALALGVRRMAARGAIVRRLPAVETLGSTSVILTDKTGTLTENRMRVDSVAPAGHPWTDPASLPEVVRAPIAQILALCNDATLDPPSGDPMEIALLEAVGASEVTRLTETHPRRSTIPFDAERKRMTTVHDVEAGRLVLVKGAPEVVLERCVLSPAERETELRRAEAMAVKGARVLALARTLLPAGADDAAAEEPELRLVGLVALGDPVRPEASDAVREATGAGIRIVMVTGDHPGTATSIADQVGLSPPTAAFKGDDIRRVGIPDDPLARSVYARVDPEEKLALVEAVRARGHVVAVTGDGVNDSPALRRADIGVAMGRSGSDVAREAADMVVTDDNLATIIHAVREGRGIYDNIRKVVDYLVAGNISEIIVVVVGLLAFPALGVPLLPLQLLWINLLTDGFPALAYGVDRTDPGLMRRGPRPRAEGLLDLRTMRLLSGRALLIAGVSLGSLVIARYAWNEPWSHARAVMFSVLVAAHLLYAFIARGPRAGRAHRGPGVWLVLAVAGGLALQLAVVTIGPLQRVFGTAPLTAREWGLVLAGSVTPPLLMTLGRRIGERRGT